MAVPSPQTTASSPRSASTRLAPQLEPLESRRLLSAILLKDIAPATASSTIYSGVPANAPAKVGDRVIFAARDAAQETDVWASDGSPEGTVKLLDLVPPGG